MQDMTFASLLRAVIAGRDLSRDQAHWAFGQVMDGLWAESQIGALLAALAAKGETSEEIAGAAQAMRERSVKIDSGGADVLDTCGTGGTGVSTFNVSTASALVCAGAGVKVAKHGNRTATRASGSADVLGELGVNLDADPACAARCLREANVCFCFAIRCHPAMKHAAPVRKSLGVRTIFNLLGPLTNPASARRQLMGVFDAALTEPIAHVLGSLGSLWAMVVHSEDGLDELSIAAPTRVSEWNGSAVVTRTITPGDAGIKTGDLSSVLVKSPRESADVIRSVLAGGAGAARDMVVLNSAAALVVAGKARDVRQGAVAAQESIDSGAAKAALAKLVETSHGR
jgi:anthranilate phosphoribosyltransferase